MDAQTQTATIGHNSAGVREILTEDPQAIFRDEAMLATLCAELEAEIEEAEVNLDTDKGRKEVASRARSIVNIKTAIDGAGKARNEDARKAIDAVDAVRRKVRDALDALRDKAREPLTKWEAAEEQRQQTIEAEKARIRELSQFSDRVTVVEIEGAIRELEAMNFPADYFRGEAPVMAAQRDLALGSARSSLEAAKVRAAEAAELERLRKAEGERLAREAEEARQKAAEKAEADRIAAEKAREERLAREAEDRARKAAEEKAAQERLKAEREAAAKLAAERAAREAAERKVREQEEAAEAERKAQAKREADARHRELIQGEVSAGIVRVTGLSGTKAQALIIAILAGEIPHTSIKF